MVEIGLADEFEKSQEVYNLYDKGLIQEAVKMTCEIEANSANYQDEFEQFLCRKYAAPGLVDIGYAIRDEDMIRRGIQYFTEWVSKYPHETDKAHELYNIANGYFSCWKLYASQYIADGIDSKDYLESLKYYRLSD